MFIKSIVIEGFDGDVEIIHLDTGALVTTGNRILCEVRKDEPKESRYAKAREVAKVVCGTTKNGAPNATNSMVHDVLNEMERVAGC
jgi:hypothetical protein